MGLAVVRLIWFPRTDVFFAARDYRGFFSLSHTYVLSWKSTETTTVLELFEWSVNAKSEIATLARVTHGAAAAAPAIAISTTTLKAHHTHCIA
jgi:hypothetical protein